MSARKPWYREPWPWILMSGPAAVLVAGGFTAWLAFSSADGLVVDDFDRERSARTREHRGSVDRRAHDRLECPGESRAVATERHYFLGPSGRGILTGGRMP